MPTRHRNRSVSFTVDDGRLVMEVRFTGEEARDYAHRCTRAVYEEVAYAIEDLADDGATLETLVDHLDVPFSQVNVALGFLRERGCVEVRRKRTYPASPATYEDAMIEFLCLAESGR